MNKLLEITWKINSDSPLLALLKLKAFPSPTYFHLEFIINLYLSLSLPHADNERPHCWSARRSGMDISESLSVCIADLGLKYAGMTFDDYNSCLLSPFRLNNIWSISSTEHLAKDVQLFAWHARRKLVKVEDVIVSSKSSEMDIPIHILIVWLDLISDAAHRNENLAASLRSLQNDLAAGNTTPRSERRRKKPAAAEKFI